LSATSRNDCRLVWGAEAWGDDRNFLDRQLGLIHVKLQTWFPFPIEVYVNGHEWVARRLDRHGVRYRATSWAMWEFEQRRP